MSAVEEDLRHRLAEMTGAGAYPRECPEIPGVYFFPSAARILNLLVKRAPHPVPYSAILEAVDWGHPHGGSSIESVRVTVSKARIRIREAGLPIPFVNIWGFGLRWTAPLRSTAACGETVETAAPSSFGPADTGPAGVPPPQPVLFP